ncbi:MAG: M56 family metallopeptidase [Planctomycetaceae bacterium]
MDNTPSSGAPHFEQTNFDNLPVRIDEDAVEFDASPSIDMTPSDAETFESTVFGNAVTSESGTEPTWAANSVQPPSSQSAGLFDPVEQVESLISTASWTWAELGVSAWFVVAGLLICRLLVSLIRLFAFVKRCTVAPDDIVTQAEETASQLGLKCRIRVVLSGPDAMPMACWLGRWIIVLPSNFMTWNAALRDATLVHELGHIARRDAWSDMLVQGVFCVFWPNPLSWLSVQDVRRLRERACDEWALQRSAIDVKTYAHCLLEVVQRCQTQRLRFASAMAGKKDLESRLRWLMSSSRPQAARPVLTSMIVASITVLGLAISTAQSTPPQQASAKESEQNGANAEPVQSEELHEVIVSKDPSPADPAISVAGIVTDTDGTPLAGMQVVLRAKVDGWYAWPMRHVRDVLARTTTNAKGRFAFSGIGIPPRMIKVLEDLRAGKSGAELIVWGEGKAVTWQPVDSFQNAEKHIQLTPEADVSGTVVDAEGRLVENAELSVSGLTKGTTELDGFMQDPGDLKLSSSEIQFRTNTRDGRFMIHNLPLDYRVSMHCNSDTGKKAFFLIDTGKGTYDTAKYRDGAGDDVTVLRTPLAAVVQQQPWRKIRVLDHEGTPVSGGGISANHQEANSVSLAEVGSDGIAILKFNKLGTYEIQYAQDPLTPAIGLRELIDIQAVESPVIEMKLVPSKILTGKVIDSESGAPIVGAYVQGECGRAADDRVPGATSAMTVTGPDGVFRLPVVGGVCVLSLCHDIDGYFSKTDRFGRSPAVPSSRISVTVKDEKVPDDVIIKIGRGLIIQGTVTDKEGHPVANAQVRADNDEAPYRKAAAVTDRNRNYEFRGFSPYVAAHVTVWTDSGTANGDILPTPGHPWTETLKKTLDMKLSPGTAITGRVVQNGVPVPGVTVKLMNAPPQPPGQDWTRYRLLAETITDADGRYNLTGLHKGEQYQFEIDAPGKGEVRDWPYQSPYGNTNNSDDGATIELPDAVLLTNGQELRGVVVDPDGTPVSGISVSASLASGGQLSRPQNGAPPWTETNEQGEFHLTNLPAEPISLRASKRNPAGGPNHYSRSLTVDLNATDIRIVVDPKLGSDIEDLDAK